MNDIRRVLTIAVLAVLALSGPVFAGEIIVDAIETAPSNIILPASTNGMMTFQRCEADCDDEHERVQLTAETRFSLDGRTLRFDEFRKEFLTIRRSESAYALVRYDTKTRQLVELIVTS